MIAFFIKCRCQFDTRCSPLFVSAIKTKLNCYFFSWMNIYGVNIMNIIRQKNVHFCSKINLLWIINQLVKSTCYELLVRNIKYVLFSKYTKNDSRLWKIQFNSFQYTQQIIFYNNLLFPEIFFWYFSIIMKIFAHICFYSEIKSNILPFLGKIVHPKRVRNFAQNVSPITVHSTVAVHFHVGVRV